MERGMYNGAAEKEENEILREETWTRRVKKVARPGRWVADDERLAGEAGRLDQLRGAGRTIGSPRPRT